MSEETLNVAAVETVAAEPAQPETPATPVSELYERKAKLEEQLKDFDAKVRIAEAKGIQPLREKMDFKDYVRNRELQQREGIHLDGEEHERLRVELAKVDGELGYDQAEQANTDDPNAIEEIVEARMLEREHIGRMHAAMEQRGLNEEGLAKLMSQIDDVVVPVVVMRTIQSFDNSADVGLYLAEHPESARKLAAMPIERGLAAVAHLSMQLHSAGSAAPTPITRAPKPPTPVTKPGSVKTPSVYDPDLSFKEYCKIRDAQERRK